MNNVSFSIVVVCLNAGAKLKQTVDSILNQRYESFEVIVKDGGSEDHSLEVLPKDQRIKIIQSEDVGIYDAMNQGAAAADGDFIYFLNCGDLFYDREVLAQVSRGIDAHCGKTGGTKAGMIVYGDIYDQLRMERVSSNPAIDAFACYRNIPCHQACFYAADLIRAKRFEQEFRVRADYEHFLWCYFKGRAACVYLPVLIARYEGGGFSETKENRSRAAQEHRIITARYMSKGQVLRYRMLLLLTLSGLRTRLAQNKKTAHLYNLVKGRLYGRKK